MNKLLYLVQITSVFSVFYLLYIIFLEKLTFHKINRIVLLSLLPISIIIPFLDYFFPAMVSKTIVIPLFESINLNTINKAPKVINTISFDSSLVFITIYLLVFSVFIINILRTIRHFFKLKKTSKIKHKDGYSIVISDVSEIFSYFNYIFMPFGINEKYHKQIIEHEKIHIKLKHSWDIIFTEVYIALFWFNPLLYLYRKSLKSVHEYQADKGVLKNGVKTSEYLQLLLQSIQVSKPNNLYNYFYQPVLKRRIIMMTKPKSNSIEKIKYIFLLPIFVFFISAFTTPTLTESDYLNVLTISEFTNEAPSLFPVKNATKSNITSYFGTKGEHSKIKRKVAHKGIDISVKIGTPVLATANGVIVEASMKGKWGNLIIITHADGYETWYAHLNGFNIDKNEQVKKGDIIGYVGNTGFSTGPHLHYEVKQNGKNLNPINYIKE